MEVPCEACGSEGYIYRGADPHAVPSAVCDICKGSGYRESEPDEVVWLRDMDGTGSMHPCTPNDPGAVRYIREDLVVVATVKSFA